VDAEEVNVELGFIVVRVAIREAFEDRMPSAHVSRSSSLAVLDS
jgi:hypothetical protein